MSVAICEAVDSSRFALQKSSGQRIDIGAHSGHAGVGSDLLYSSGLYTSYIFSEKRRGEMAAYMVVLLNCRNTDWLEEYIKHVPSIFRKFGGEYVGVSSSVKKLEGPLPAPEQMAIFRFPTTGDIERFVSSDAYKPFLELRRRNSEAEILMFDSQLESG
jgi:uncharacterized protein (DUF1330 family)